MKRLLGGAVLVLVSLFVVVSAAEYTAGWISPEEMAEILATEQVLAFDQPEWLERIGKLDQPAPRTVPGPPPSYSVGDIEQFYFYDEVLDETTTIQAELCYITDHVYMWVEKGMDVERASLLQAARYFEDVIYSKDREYLGEEWSPGVDNDAHISILHLAYKEESAGQFGSTDEYTREVEPESNQREMFYVNLNEVDLGSDDYPATLAHEFQHMIQWHNPGPEANWLDEGLAQVAELLCGFEDTVFTVGDFLANSRIQLNAWSETFAGADPYYGASYLYVVYLWERLGDVVLQSLARHPSAGLASVNETLAEHGLDLTADTLFADWTVANYLDDPSLADGDYGYHSENLAPICPRLPVDTLPMHSVRTLPQYAADYIEIQGQGLFVVDFRGVTESQLVPTHAHSGDSFWWSNRGDQANMTLTRAFDLSGLNKATLRFWVWYDVHKWYDYVYVEASTDGGTTWDVLSGRFSEYDPDYDIVPYYTGISGGGTAPKWMREEIDLSPYAGQKMLLRFEYITDTYFNGPGFAVDDLAIPELGYTYDVESGYDGWKGEGFVRTSNVVPQNWAIHLVQLGSQPVVKRLLVSEAGTAHVEVSLTHESPKAVIIVGAMAPVTKEEARYEISVMGDGVLAEVPLPGPQDALYYDAFCDVCSGWETYGDAEMADGYEDGAYFIDVKVPDWYGNSLAGQHFTNFVIDVDTIQDVPAEDNSYGIVCRYQDEENFYLFEISNDGYFSISALVNNEWMTLVDWTESAAINCGQGAKNHLTVTCKGDRLNLAVNGQELTEITDGTFLSGDIGLTASTYSKGGARVVFDNLVVWSLGEATTRSVREHVPEDHGAFPYREDFSNIRGGWDTYSDSDVGCGYTDGAYFLEVKNPDWWFYSLSGQSFTNFVLDVDTLQVVAATDNTWGAHRRGHASEGSHRRGQVFILGVV